MIFAKDKRIFIKTGSTDMRKQINGLALLAQEAMPELPLSGAYFVFWGKTHRIIKVLYWDSTGFCLWIKWLEAESFPWPGPNEDICEITRQQLRLALRGIDVFAEHRTLEYSSVA